MNDIEFIEDSKKREIAKEIIKEKYKIYGGIKSNLFFLFASVLLMLNSEPNHFSFYFYIFGIILSSINLYVRLLEKKFFSDKNIYQYKLSNKNNSIEKYHKGNKETFNILYTRLYNKGLLIYYLNGCAFLSKEQMNKEHIDLLYQ